MDCYLNKERVFPLMKDLVVENCPMITKLGPRPLSAPKLDISDLLDESGLQKDPRYGAWVEHQVCKNMEDALRQILLTEGLAGLYIGIVPSIVEAAPAGAVTFVAYEFTLDCLESILN
ncbi:unnamed protein product [Fraxinus pennsylvanica]|uniref:Uncharacterized protein n=1 Tax=Fraxinus pennsylvanica TaxID=56036 RepID=A0AAD2DWI4_9LAMI|nr:unnamed protein product [Fraxinus pennsylvanica]